MTEASK